jgi:hypothetical protein
MKEVDMRPSVTPLPEVHLLPSRLRRRLHDAHPPPSSLVRTHTKNDDERRFKSRRPHQGTRTRTLLQTPQELVSCVGLINPKPHSILPRLGLNFLSRALGRILQGMKDALFFADLASLAYFALMTVGYVALPVSLLKRRRQVTSDE